MYRLLPLGLAFALAAAVVLAPFLERLDAVLDRVSVSLFGEYVSRPSSTRTRRIELLRTAHAGVTHRVFASRTLLVAVGLGVAGAVTGGYLLAGFIALLAVSAETFRALLPTPFHFLIAGIQQPSFTTPELLGLLALAGGGFGVVAAGTAYWGRWRYLETRAAARASQIDATLPRTVAFVYALSRSGMPFSKVLQTVTENERVYGEAARELGVAVRDMNAFGTDILTALQDLAQRTPSHRMEEFGENLASVLGSGRNLSTFLRQQYERYQAEAEARQERYLEFLGTLAEIYVTVLVAGPLFFVTVLVVVGLVIQNTLAITRFMAYVAIPLASAGFVVYVDSIAQSLGIQGQFAASALEDEPAGPQVPVPTPDGGVPVDGWSANRERLRAYDRFRSLRRWVERPAATLLENPAASLVVTVPLGVAVVAARAGPVPLGPGAVAVLDGPVVLAAALVLGVYTLIHELRKRRLRAIERVVPDFLDRLASVNEAGMTVIASLERVSKSDLGALGPEVERTWRDVEWGADAATALGRMEGRLQTPMVSRAVSLITNAMAASSDIAPVLRIAATEAQDTRSLHERRQQEMFTYLVVIYISFFVFLAIVVALTVSFVPAIENAASQASANVERVASPGVPTGMVGSLRDIPTEAYGRLLFHIAAIQAVCSGVIAGKLGEGSVGDGLKHATVMLLFTYLLFQFI